MDRFVKNSRENKRIKNKNKIFVYSSKHIRKSLEKSNNQIEKKNK